MTFSWAANGAPAGGTDDDPPAGEALAQVVVGVALEAQRDAARDERAEALAGRAREAQVDRVVGQPVAAPAAGDLGAEHRAHGPVDVPDRERRPGPAGPPRGRARTAPAGSSRRATPPRRAPGRSCGRRPSYVPGTSGWARIRLKSRPRAFQWSSAGRISRRSDRPTISSIVRKPRRAMCSRTSGAMKRHEVDDVLRVAGEALAQLRVLRGDAHRAGVEVAGAHHHAAQRDERRGGEAELLGAQQRADHHVAAGLELAVHLDRDPRCAGRSSAGPGGPRRGPAPTGRRRA